MTDLHSQLKNETAEIHSQLESCAFFKELGQRKLARESVIGFLRGLGVVHAALERALAVAKFAELARLSSLAPPKLGMIENDLELLEARKVPSIGSALKHAIGVADALIEKSDQPLWLLGYLYVLEGSQNGGVALRESFARDLGVQPEQLSYFGCYGNQTAQRWRAFSEGLRSLALKEEEKQLVAQAAKHCFEGIAAMVQALHPFNKADLTHHVAAINFEAGTHAMPQDPARIELALNAAARAWRSQPYLQARFGSRGRRFTSSDSCWLVTLADAPALTATKSLVWLRTVLSTRGLPTVILESHLREIARDLGNAQTSYDSFFGLLTDERMALLGATKALELEQKYEQAFGDCPEFKIAGAAALLISAWCDEKSGIVGALAATSGWFRDPARFSGQWIATVDSLLGELC